jgi:hypothetical protein
MFCFYLFYGLTLVNLTCIYLPELSLQTVYGLLIGGDTVLQLLPLPERVQLDQISRSLHCKNM